jgi:glycosyltransferase involved in cell wall biosynthesis
MTTLAVVVPCYNEEQVLPETAHRLSELLQGLIDAGKVSGDSHICFVDDGSRDRTWALIEQLSPANPMIKGIKLSRNRGHQNALLCGLMNAEGDVVISMDADLQDDLSAIADMLEAQAQGCDVVYGVRSQRDTDTFFKRFTAHAYYKLLRTMGVDVVFDHADYRLLTRRAIEALREYEESNLFLRGIIPTLGFNSAKVYYERRERFAGESKYPLHKMLGLAFEGITSFSPLPLRMIAALGIVVTVISAFLGLWTIAVRLFTDTAVPGWASTVVPVYFLGGLQLLGIGVIGEYLAKVYMEVKRRPRYIIEKRL